MSPHARPRSSPDGGGVATPLPAGHDLEHLHPEAAERVLAARLRPRSTTFDASRMRDDLAAATRDVPRAGGLDTENTEVGPPTQRVSIRVHRPRGVSGRRPVIVFAHGGSWVAGGLDSHDGDATHLAVGTGSVVVSVDYRLAPEHPFPAGLDDIATVLRWLVSNDGPPDVDCTRIVLAGVSSGANLVAAAAILARDGVTPPIVGQVLVFPIIDPSLDRPSHERYGEGHLLTTASLRWAWSVYCGDSQHDPLAAPLGADVSGVAPAYVLVAGCDPLVDEGIAYAGHLHRGGAPVVLDLVAGQVHGFFSAPGISPSAAEAHRRVATWIHDLVRHSDRRSFAAGRVR